MPIRPNLRETAWSLFGAFVGFLAIYRMIYSDLELVWKVYLIVVVISMWVHTEFKHVAWMTYRLGWRWLTNPVDNESSRVLE